MSHNPPKNDAWRPYPDVRFVLVRNVGRLKPSRGLILSWDDERRPRRAFVVYWDDTGLRPTGKYQWFPKDRLIPVRVDPNWRDS
ncbi:hypothetical protein GCM10028801_44490 [Nocardioides maradonensis]